MIEIPARPFAFRCPPERLALVVIDMQRDFVEPGGFGASLGNDVTRLQSIIPTVRRLLDGFRAARISIIHTKEAHKPDLSDCPPSKLRRAGAKLGIGDVGPMGRILIAGEPGNDIVPDLAPFQGEPVLEKPGKGAFYRTPLADMLAKFRTTHLAFCGVTTEVCVQTTMREAADRGFECLIVEDATESYFPEFRTAAIAMMTAQGGIVGCATTSDELLRAITVPAPSPR